MDYAASMKHIERLIDQRRLDSAMREMGTVLEQLLKDLYRSLLPRLKPTDRAAVTQVERDTATRLNKSEGVETFTLGQLQRFLQNSGFLEKAASAGLGTRALALADLKPFVDARNDATHQAAPPSENEVRLYYHQLVQYLDETGRLATTQPLSAGAMLQPWTDVVTPHTDIQQGQLEMSTYAADLWAVAMEGERCPEVYRTPAEFFKATYLTNNLTALLSDVVQVLGGGAGDRVLQLRTPFGGGKTHALIALYHLAASDAKQRHAILATLNQKRNTALPDPGTVNVAVLHGLSLDFQKPRQPEAHITLHTLWGELAYQLGGSATYELVRLHDEQRTVPGKPILQQVIGSEPALILLDELLIYVERANTLIVGASPYGRQVLIFLQILTETIRGLERAAMVYSLQFSTSEAFGSEALLNELDHLVSRIDSKREPVGNEEVLKVVQRRLFSDIGDRQVRAAVAKAYAERYRSHIEADDPAGATQEARRLEARILDSYPLHPDLLDLMYHRWGSLPSYQRTRGALQFLATAISAVYADPGSAQPLLGPSDVLLDNDAVRNTLFSQVGERETFSSVLAADVLMGGRSDDTNRRIGDVSPVLRRLKVGTRVATAAFLYSFGARQGEDRGVVRDDLITACLSPDLDRNIITTALHELQESLLYLHYTTGRYRFETKPNLNKLLADQARQFEGSDVLIDIKSRLETVIGRVQGSEPRLWPEDTAAIPDHVPSFLVGYLGVDWASLGRDELESKVRQWIDFRGGGRRDHKNGLALALPSAARLDEARQHTRMLLAVETLRGARTRYNLTDDQVDDLRDRQGRLTGDIQASLRRLYELVALPVEAQAGAADPVAIEWLDLRAQPLSGETIHERVIEALRHWVFTSVTPTKLVGLTKLGHDDQAQTLSCATLVTWCFSFLTFPKLLGLEPIKAAIAQGVRDGIFGYSAALQTDSQGQPFVADHQLVKMNTALAPHEIDLGATSYLLAPGLAKQLAQPPQPIVQTNIYTPSESSERGTQEATGDFQIASNDLTPSVQTTSATSTTPRTSGKRYRLRFTANKQQLFRAFRPLQNLAEKAGTLEVTLDVVARSEGSLDASWLRNAVEEPLDEADVQFDGALEE